MHFLYVDESGDVGRKPGSSSHFVLTGLLIHHTARLSLEREVKALRLRMKGAFGFPEDAEMHAAELLSKNSDQFGIALEKRIRCALHAVGFIRNHPELHALRAIHDKTGDAGCAYAIAWGRLLEQAANRQALDSSAQDCPSTGLIVVCDDHRTAPRRSVLSSLPHYRKDQVIDLPFGMDSRDSMLLQLADLTAYLTKQELAPAATFQGRLGRPLLKRNADLFA